MIKVIVLYGGRSGEHEVSLRSAASVLTQLDSNKYTVIPIGMDKEGKFYLNSYEELLQAGEVLPVKTQTSIVLPSLLKDGQLAVEADVVFPVVHGPLYEDGSLQGLLELCGAAYVGCNVLSSAMGMDKDIARRIACDAEIACAKYQLLSGYLSDDSINDWCDNFLSTLQWPLFVKPCALGSSVGIHKVQNKAELIAAIHDARRYDFNILIESFVQGREIELSVLENPLGEPLVSIPGEIKVHHEDGFYSYAAKYLQSEKTSLHIPAQLDNPLIQRLQVMAATIFTRLRCQGMARVDFFVNDKSGEIYFNEINTLPGFTSISMYPKLWEASGLLYPTLLDKLIDLALIRHQHRLKLVTHYQ